MMVKGGTWLSVSWPFALELARAEASRTGIRHKVKSVRVTSRFHMWGVEPV